jgi:hypothetical protein
MVQTSPIVVNLAFLSNEINFNAKNYLNKVKSPVFTKSNPLIYLPSTFQT